MPYLVIYITSKILTPLLNILRYSIRGALLQLPGALTPHVRGSRVTGSQAAQLETFHNSCMSRMMGRYRGTGGPSTAELLDGTGQMPISQLLSRHRIRWLGHAARKPADNIPGRPRPVGRPHYTWMDGAMQDLNALGPWLQLDFPFASCI